MQHSLVFGGNHLIRPQTGGLGVVFHKGNLLRLAAGQFQVGDGLTVDVEHRRSRAVFRAHVGDGRAVADREAVRACAKKFDPGADHLFFAQELGQRQHDVGGRDAGLTLANQFDTNDVGQAHHGRET